MNNTLWHKDKNGLYTFSDDSITFKEFLENLKSTSSLDIKLSDNKKPVIYIPTHNIHDTYEWFRIFKDSHIYGNIPYNQNFDKYGFWIHGYFDKALSQNINTYFPNLYLVKATSSDIFIFDGVIKKSADFINIGSIFTELIIDGVEIFNNEKILLKNQYYETLTVHTINSTISTNNAFYISYTIGLENLYNVGGILRVQENSNWIEKNIVNVSLVTITTPNDYLKIDIDVNVLDISVITNIGDSTNGLYTKTSLETQNGVYTYTNNALVRMPEMGDKYKTYNQIVYTYQGLTNENNEYYLRRIEDELDINYSLYPYDSLLLPFIYSKGEAYLIKCEFDYNLNINEPLHPEVTPFNITGQEDCYRMLFLDHDIAEKIMLKDDNGVGTYDNTVNNTILSIGPGINTITYAKRVLDTIRFYTYNNIGTQTKNVIHQYLNEGRFIGYPLSVGTPTVYNTINAAESSLTTQLNKIEFKNILNPILTTKYTSVLVSPPLIGSGIYISNLTDTTFISAVSDIFGNSLNSLSITAGYFLKLKITTDKFGTGDITTVIDDTFLITNNFTIGVKYVLNIFPKLDNDIINIIKEINTYSSCSITLEAVNAYGRPNSVGTLITPQLDLELLESAINKTELKNMYEFVYESDITNYCSYASTANITNLIFTSAPQLLTGLDGATPITISPGVKILIKDQSIQTENGIYIYKGLGTKLERYTDEPLLLTNNYLILNGGTNKNKIFKPAYILLPTETEPNFGTTNITFTLNNVNIQNRLIVNNAKQHYSKKWEYYGFRYELVTSAIFGNFNIYFDNPKNVNNVNVLLDSLYGKNYNVFNYLSQYLGFSSIINDLQLDQLQAFTLNYTPSGINNLFLYDKNKIKFGELNKSYFLDNIKKHQFIIINRPLTSTFIYVFVNDIKWFDDVNYGEVDIDYHFKLSDTPSTGEAVEISNALVNFSNLNQFLKLTNKSKMDYFSDFNNILGLNTNINSLIIDTNKFGQLRPNTSAYAHALMNPLHDTNSNIPNSSLLQDLTAIWFKEEGTPKVSFRKRDKTFRFPDYFNVTCASTGNVTILNPTILQIGTNTDGIIPNIGDLILLKNQTISTENGIYYYNGIGNQLQPWTGATQNSYYFVQSGITLINNVYKLTSLTLPIIFGTSNITFTLDNYKLKSDKRLTLKPIEIAKLGVNNNTQPWQKISYKYDILESEENLVNIQLGINNKRKIRFIDGLTENNILNNINGQGQYLWILDDDVIVEDAIVGCTKDFGPGTGTLIWYTGKWISGTWINGIWTQGEWFNGVWTNGIFNSLPIEDYYYNVLIDTISINNLSVWHNGIWIDGTFNNGTWLDGTWHTGTHNDGIWKDGLWIDGVWNCGIFESGKWITGFWNGGDFETGEWLSGTFDQTTVNCISRFGTKSVTNTSIATINNRSIWHSGTFIDGEVWSGSKLINNILTPNLDDQRGTIFFSVNFKNGIWKAGSCILASWNSGIFESGVWFGGYKSSFITNSTTTSKQMYIDAKQYHNILYLPLTYNVFHNVDKIGETKLYLRGLLTTANQTTQGVNVNIWNYLLFDMFDANITGSVYLPKSIDTNYTITSTNVNILADVTGDILAPAPLFVTENSSTGDLDSSPFICSLWKNGTFVNGTWLNGFWLNGIFKTGFQRTGIFLDGTFGIDTE